MEGGGDFLQARSLIPRTLCSHGCKTAHESPDDASAGYVHRFDLLNVGPFFRPVYWAPLKTIPVPEYPQVQNPTVPVRGMKGLIAKNIWHISQMSIRYSQKIR